MRRLLTLTLFLGGMVAIAQPPADSAKPQTRPAANPIPDSFTNLLVLPKDISKRQLMGVMKGFSISMQARCSHCHAVSDDLTQGSFASDEKEAKGATRELLRAILATQHDLKTAPQGLS